MYSDDAMSNIDYYENGSSKLLTIPLSTSINIINDNNNGKDVEITIQQYEQNDNDDTPYQIFVRLYDQSIITVNNPRTLEDIEKYIEDRVGLNKNEQIYSINGRPIYKKQRDNNSDDSNNNNNNRITLKEQNILNHSTIDLNLRLNGGMDGMAIFTIAIVVGIIIYAIYRAVKAVVNFSKWSWKICLRAPTCWCCKNVTLPVCDCGRALVYTTKESCFATCDCCSVYYNPWQKMDVV